MNIQKKSIYLSVFIFSVSMWYFVCHFSFVFYENSLRGSAFKDIKAKTHNNNLVVFENMEDRLKTCKKSSLGPFKLLKNIYKSSDNMYDYEFENPSWLITTAEIKENGCIYSSHEWPVRIYSESRVLSQNEIVNILLKAFDITKNEYKAYNEQTSTEYYNTLEDIKASFGYGNDVYLNENRNTNMYGSKVIKIDGCKVFIMKGTAPIYTLCLKNDLDKTRRIVFYCGLFIIVLFVLISHGKGVRYGFISKRIELSMWVFLGITISYIVFSYLDDNYEKINEENAIQVAKFDEDIRGYYPQIEQTADQVAYVKELEIRTIDYVNSLYYGDIEENICNSLNSLYASSKKLRILRADAELSSGKHARMKLPTYCKHDKTRIEANEDYKRIIWTTFSLSKMSAYDVHNNDEYDEFKNKCDSLIRNLRYQTTTFSKKYNFLFE